MRQLFFIVLSLASTTLLAQTKKIAHKSHSGSAENFRIALDEHLFDIDNSNFGDPPPKVIKTIHLDSVIFISDTVAVMVTSEYSGGTDVKDPAPKFIKTGKEIVHNHPLFSRKHSLDSIKRVLNDQYNFKNPIEKVVFIGFDNGKPGDSLKRQFIPFTTINKNNNNNNDTGLDPQAKWMFGVILLLALIAGLVSWKFAPMLLRREVA